MKFKKGNKVEVLSRNDVPSGSWRCAEIVCGNGRYYTVRYDGYRGADDVLLEKLSRKAIRPCPPFPDAAEKFGLGDVIEVFDDFSWKMATISKVLGKDYFMVRLLGSCMEFKVSKFDIRVRQSWQDEKWVVIGQGSTSCQDRKQQNLTLRFNKNSRIHPAKSVVILRLKDDCSTMLNKEKIKKTDVPSYTNLKRRRLDYSQAEVYDGAATKIRAIETDGMVRQVDAANQFSKQMNATALHQEILGDKFMQFSSNFQSQFSEMDAEKRKSAGIAGCSFAELESSDANSVTCSVGSCSVTSKKSFKLWHHTGFLRDIDNYSSDAESFCPREYEEADSFFQKENLAAEIHRLELHAYRCTIEALHASGPLSWEQEALVTNLRLSLHISNDEHLMEGQCRRLSHLYEMLSCCQIHDLLVISGPLSNELQICAVVKKIGPACRCVHIDESLEGFISNLSLLHLYMPSYLSFISITCCFFRIFVIGC